MQRDPEGGQRESPGLSLCVHLVWRTKRLDGNGRTESSKRVAPGPFARFSYSENCMRSIYRVLEGVRKFRLVSSKSKQMKKR